MKASNFSRDCRLCLLGCAVWLFCDPILAQESGDDEGDDEPTVEISTSRKHEVQSLREQLTEREDETRVEDPVTIYVFGRSLALTGQYEISFDFAHRVTLGDPEERFGEALFEQEVEAEAFYTLSPTVSLFAQLRIGTEKELDSRNPDHVSGAFLERGEFWLDAQKIGGSPFSLEVGRLHFEDDRRWWWDEELDAVRLTYERGQLEVTLALARELAPNRTNREFVDPQHDDVVRVIEETSWDWAANHTLQFFGLFHHDSSPAEQPGEKFRRDDTDDETDGTFLWLGVRAAGACDFKENGVLGYWIDLGGVVGDEHFVSTVEVSEGEEEVASVQGRDVLGGGLDAGMTYMLSAPGQPRITLGYAIGSGEDKPDGGTDYSYHQTGLQENEPGFGGVQSFKGYGRLLDPELSNLSIVTVGVGCRLFKSSSLDLVFHDYRLVEPATSLRDSRIDCHLNGKDRDVGRGLDLVLALEEWKQFEFEFSVSAFGRGDAFGPGAGEWIGGSFAAFRFAF